MEVANRNLNKIRTRLALSLLINGGVPLVLYVVLRQFIASDAVALALAGLVPVVRTIVLFVWRRRLDWIGLLAVIGFAVGLVISYLSGGSPLALELHGSALTGTVGIVCLISVVVGRPLLAVLINSFDKGLYDRLSRERLTTLTAVIGLALCGKTAADIILAMTLPTSTFLAVSRVVNWAILGCGFLYIWWTRSRTSHQVGS